MSAKTLCTVSIINCKANMSCNHALQLCFLHESQRTLQRKRNIAIPIASGWFLFHRCSYHTTRSPRACFLGAALAIKRISPVMHLDRHTQEGWTHGLKHFISKSVSLENIQRLEKIFHTDTQAQTPVCSFGFIVYNDFSFQFYQHILLTNGNG